MRGDSVQFDIFLDFFAMIIVVPECVEDLCETQVRQTTDDFFGAFPKFPALHNRTDRCAGGFNNWFPAQHIWNAFDIWMISHRAIRDFRRRKRLAQALQFRFERVKTSEKSLKIERKLCHGIFFPLKANKV